MHIPLTQTILFVNLLDRKCHANREALSRSLSCDALISLCSIPRAARPLLFQVLFAWLAFIKKKTRQSQKGRVGSVCDGRRADRPRQCKQIALRNAAALFIPTSVSMGQRPGAHLLYDGAASTHHASDRRTGQQNLAAGK